MPRTPRLTAGPWFAVREIVIIAADGDPRWIAADLLAQAEHDVDASAILLTTSRSRRLDVVLVIAEERSVRSPCSRV
jgi:histidinol dehydrogenase